MAPDKCDQSPKGGQSRSKVAYNGHTLTLSSTLAKAISQRGAHWNILYADARDTIADIRQNRFGALALTCARYIHLLPSMDGMSKGDNVLYWITHFLDRTHGFATSREAILYLSRSCWNLDDAVERWCDTDNFAHMGKEVCSDSEQGDVEEPSEEEDMAPLNHNVDRKPAVKGRATLSKFSIVLQQPGGKPDKRNEYKDAKHRGAFDWNNSVNIRALNRWRSQILRRNLGSARAARVSFHEIEVEWLYQKHVAFQLEARARNEAVSWNRIKWDKVTADFNAQFCGTVLPGAKGVRPSRTKASLMTERYRVPRITELAGLTLKKGSGKKRADAGVVTDAVVEDVKDDNLEDMKDDNMEDMNDANMEDMKDEDENMDDIEIDNTDHITNNNNTANNNNTPEHEKQHPQPSPHRPKTPDRGAPSSSRGKIRSTPKKRL